MLDYPHHEPWLKPEEYSGSLFIDLGCYQGWWSINMSNQFATVISVDASPANITYLQSVLAERGLGNVHPICVALIADNSIRLTDFDKNHPEQVHAVRTVLEPETGFLSVAQPAHAVLESIIAGVTGARPQLASNIVVKCDIEGEECGLLSKYGVLAAPDVKTWLVEIHTVDNGHAMHAAFRRAGYQVEPIRHPNYAPDTYEYNRHYWLKAVRSW